MQVGNDITFQNRPVELPVYRMRCSEKYQSKRSHCQVIR